MLILQAGNPQMMQIILFGGIFVVFYFFMIRPQQKKAKEAKKFIEELKNNPKYNLVNLKNFRMFDKKVTSTGLALLTKKA